MEISQPFGCFYGPGPLHQFLLNEEQVLIVFKRSFPYEVVIFDIQKERVLLKGKRVCLKSIKIYADIILFMDRETRTLKICDRTTGVIKEKLIGKSKGRKFLQIVRYCEDESYIIVLFSGKVGLLYGIVYKHLGQLYNFTGEINIVGCGSTEDQILIEIQRFCEILANPILIQ